MGRLFVSATLGALVSVGCILLIKKFSPEITDLLNSAKEKMRACGNDDPEQDLFDTVDILENKD